MDFNGAFEETSNVDAIMSAFQDRTLTDAERGVLSRFDPSAQVKTLVYDDASLNEFKYDAQDPNDPNLIIGDERREELSQFDSSFIFDRQCKHTWTFDYERPDYVYKENPTNLLEENWQIARGRWVKKCMGCGTFGPTKYTYFDLGECVEHELEDAPMGIVGVKRCKECNKIFNMISSDTHPGDNAAFLKDYSDEFRIDLIEHEYQGDESKLSTQYLLKHGY